MGKNLKRKSHQPSERPFISTPIHLISLVRCQYASPNNKHRYYKVKSYLRCRIVRNPADPQTASSFTPIIEISEAVRSQILLLVVRESGRLAAPILDLLWFCIAPIVITIIVILQRPVRLLFAEAHVPIQFYSIYIYLRLAILLFSETSSSVNFLCVVGSMWIGLWEGRNTSPSFRFGERFGDTSFDLLPAVRPLFFLCLRLSSII